MIRIATLALTLALASPALAENPDMPDYDIPATCKVLSAGNTVADVRCLNIENKAYSELALVWDDAKADGVKLCLAAQKAAPADQRMYAILQDCLQHEGAISR